MGVPEQRRLRADGPRGREDQIGAPNDGRGVLILAIWTSGPATSCCSARGRSTVGASRARIESRERPPAPAPRRRASPAARHDFWWRLPGKRPDDERAPRQCEAGAAPPPRVGAGPALIEERVADELDRHPGPPIQRRSNGIDGRTSDTRLRIVPPPLHATPTLRGTEVTRRGRRRARRSGQEEIEFREVDQDQRGGAPPREARPQLPVSA